MDEPAEIPGLLSMMLVKHISNMLLGALLSLVAAYSLIVTVVLKNEVARIGLSSINWLTILIGAPLYTLVHTYWLIIPIGLLFGLVIPLLVSKKTKGQAVVFGILTGAVIGLVLACFSAYDFAAGTSLDSDTSVKWWGRFWGELPSSAPVMIVYCSIWTTVYSFFKAGTASIEQDLSSSPEDLSES